MANFSLISFLEKKFVNLYKEITTQFVSWNFWRDILLVLTGIIIYSIAFSLFIYPQNITTGGLMGICNVIKIVTSLPIDVPYNIINFSLLFLAFIMLDANFFLKTLISVATLAFTVTFATRLTVPDPNAPVIEMLLLNDQRVVALIIGSLLTGLGLGFVFSVNGCTGGTDVIVALISKYKKNLTFGRIFMFVDGTVVTTSFFANVFLAPEHLRTPWNQGLELLIYSIIQVMMVSITLDWYIRSNKQSVQFMIFSPKYKEINEAITKKLNRGCTIIEAKGGYTGEDRKVLMVVARRRATSMISKTVEEIDPNAFMSQAEVKGVYGQGFESIQKVQ